MSTSLHILLATTGVAANTIYQNKIDILVDLNGHSKGGRADIVALKPAPVRLLFLGFAGTLGSNRVVQYLTGDRHCSPPRYVRMRKPACGFANPP